MKCRFSALIVSLLLSLTCVSNAHAEAKLPDLKAKLLSKLEGKSAEIDQDLLMARLKNELNRELGLKAVRKVERAKNQKVLIRVLKNLNKRCKAKCPVLTMVVKSLSANKRAFKHLNQNGCGPFHCLSQWGCHIPCKGLPSGNCKGGGKGDEDCSVAHPDCKGKGKVASRSCIQCIANIGMASEKPE